MTTDAFPDDAALESALRASRTLEDAPEALIQRAIGLWQAPARGAAPPRRRLLAVLGFDSAGAAPLAFGRRSTGTEVRQLLFSAEGRDLDLRVTPAAGGRWQVAGQVFGPDTIGVARAEVGSERAEAAWNELCEWRFDALPAGECRIVLAGEGWEIELPPFTLG